MEIRYGPAPIKPSYEKDVKELLQHLETINFDKNRIHYFEPTYPEFALNAESYVYVRLFEFADKEKVKELISFLGGKICDEYEQNSAFWFSL